MNHIKYEQWVLYVKDELDEETRQMYEEHMFICDSCLELYSKAIESYNHTLPQLPEDFTDKIIDHITEKTTPPLVKEKTESKVRKSLLHYTVAAAMTVILMTSGLFGHLLQIPSTFAERSSNIQNESLTDQLLNKKINFMEVFDRYKEVE